MEVRPGARDEAQQQIHQARYGRQMILRTDEITPNPRNPRRAFGTEGLAQLAESMKRDGQIQPVVVRRVGDTWQLVVGERRWRAAKLAGLIHLSAVEREATDEAAFRLAIIENIHREDLSHQEKVEALDTLSDIVATSGLRRAAAELNMSPGWLSRRLSMRRDATIFPALEDGRITFMQPNELLSAPAAARRTLLDRVLRRPRQVQIKELREWVDQTRREMRQSQQRTIARIASTDDDSRTQSAQSYARFLNDLRQLPDPTTSTEFEALQQIADHVKQMLRRVRPTRLKVAG
jgi:ParB/RepB/Spo0J family partition protein